MACHEEHCFLLQAAIERSAWGRRRASGDGSRSDSEPFGKYLGWEAGAKDVFNRMATFSDTVGDWMWHMAPWADAALQYGAAKVADDLRRGDEDGASLKAAFLTHYVVDPLAVSHTWLYLMGEIWEFESDEVLHKEYHDPVEYPIGKRLGEVTLEPPEPPRPFADVYADCLQRAFAIGREILEEYRGAKNYIPILKKGVQNSARCIPAFLDDLRNGKLEAVRGEAVRFAGKRWMGRLFMDWPGARIRGELFLPETIALLKRDMGYEGANIFFHREKCTPEAVQEYERFRTAREEWRRRMGIATRVKP